MRDICTLGPTGFYGYASPEMTRDGHAMTSWVITIDKDHPQHWAIAKRHRFWDMTKHFPIELGDTIYFWQAGESMVAQCRATASAFPIDSRQRTPWQDGGLRTYRARVDLQVLSERPRSRPRWSELQSRMRKKVMLQTPRAFDDARDEAALAALF